MPVYEEKFISPLAVRFTQEHIRNTFRDRRSVPAAVEEIKAGPGHGDYDVVLSFPFPAIEVMRSPAAKQHNSVLSDLSQIIGEKGEGSHWFTLDNRRLYCLQRAAVKLWPLRVAAKVDVLYADNGSGRKKYDSISYGCSVTISSSIKDSNCSRWDWRYEVMPQQLLSAIRSEKLTQLTDVAHSALSCVLADDRKAVDDLLDPPQTSGKSVLPLLTSTPAQNPFAAGDASFEFEKPTYAKDQARSCSPSTTASSDEWEAGACIQSFEHTMQLGCKASKAFQQQQRNSWEPKVGAIQPTSAPQKAWEVWWEEGAAETWDYSWYDHLAAAAVNEIEQQIQMPDWSGLLWIENWNEHYFAHLGSLRTFVESRPDKFTVVPGKGRSYRVTLASGAPAQTNPWRPRTQAYWEVGKWIPAMWNRHRKILAHIQQDHVSQWSADEWGS